MLNEHTMVCDSNHVPFEYKATAYTAAPPNTHTHVWLTFLVIWVSRSLDPVDCVWAAMVIVHDWIVAVDRGCDDDDQFRWARATTVPVCMNHCLVLILLLSTLLVVLRSLRPPLSLHDIYPKMVSDRISVGRRRLVLCRRLPNAI